MYGCKCVRVYRFIGVYVYCRFCELVNSLTEETWKGPDEAECDAETLEVHSHTHLFNLTQFSLICIAHLRMDFVNVIVKQIHS